MSFRWFRGTGRQESRALPTFKNCVAYEHETKWLQVCSLVNFPKTKIKGGPGAELTGVYIRGGLVNPELLAENLYHDMYMHVQ
jgi:hypothetical protein